MSSKFVATSFVWPIALLLVGLCISTELVSGQSPPLATESPSHLPSEGGDAPSGAMSPLSSLLPPSEAPPRMPNEAEVLMERVTPAGVWGSRPPEPQGPVQPVRYDAPSSATDFSENSASAPSMPSAFPDSAIAVPGTSVWDTPGAGGGSSRPAGLPFGAGSPPASSGGYYGTTPPHTPASSTPPTSPSTPAVAETPTSWGTAPPGSYGGPSPQAPVNVALNNVTSPETPTPPAGAGGFTHPPLATVDETDAPRDELEDKEEPKDDEDDSESESTVPWAFLFDLAGLAAIGGMFYFLTVVWDYQRRCRRLLEEKADLEAALRRASQSIDAVAGDLRPPRR